MTFYDIMLLLIVGYTSGILSGMFGIGGGVLIVPALTLATGMNLKEASGTSLAALLLPVGILGCIVYYKERLLDFKAAAAVALGIITTIGIGAYLANIISLDILQICYSVFLIYIGLRFIEPINTFNNICKYRNSEDIPKSTSDNLLNELPTTDKSNEKTGNNTYFICYIVGLLAGLNAGFFGVGGGAVIVPLLCLWLNFPAKKAIATSMGVLLPPIGLPGAIVFYHAGNLNLQVAAIVAVGLLLGAILGAKITVKLPAHVIKIAFGILLIGVGIKFSMKLL